MQTLMSAPLNKPCNIKAIHTSDTKLLARFISFGINTGASVIPLHHSSRHATLALQVQGTQIALRESEAKKIEVTY